jgi:hypothetical protein
MVLGLTIAGGEEQRGTEGAQLHVRVAQVAK